MSKPSIYLNSINNLFPAFPLLPPRPFIPIGRRSIDLQRDTPWETALLSQTCGFSNQLRITLESVPRNGHIFKIKNKEINIVKEGKGRG